MRVVTLVRNWLVGLGMFVAMTASLVVAFGVAISGPPTDEEMASVDEALGIAGAEAERVSQNVMTRVCADWPELCGAQTVVAEAPEPSASPPTAPPRYEPDIAEATPPPAHDAGAALLGDETGAVTTPAPEIRERPAEVRPRATPRPRARAPAPRRGIRTPAPPPIQVEQRAALTQLMEGVASVLSRVPAAYDPELRPDQTEQEVQSEDTYEDAPDEGYWDDEVDWREYEDEEEEPYPELWYN